MIKFAHVRPLVENGKHYLGGKKVKVKPTKGGYTIAFERHDNVNAVAYAIAVCSDKENFCKRIGRNVAAGRLKFGGYSVPCKITDKYADIVARIIEDIKEQAK